MQYFSDLLSSCPANWVLDNMHDGVKCSFYLGQMVPHRAYEWSSQSQLLIYYTWYAEKQGSCNKQVKLFTIIGNKSVRIYFLDPFVFVRKRIFHVYTVECSFHLRAEEVYVALLVPPIHFWEKKIWADRHKGRTLTNDLPPDYKCILLVCMLCYYYY